MYINGVNIKKHKRLIWNLLARHNDDNLAGLIRHMSGNASPEERSAIADEIRRLAEPCTRKMDFRSFFIDMCESLVYEGVQHYLDPNSAKKFHEFLESTNGVYNLAIYEELTRDAKERYIELQEELQANNEMIPATALTLDRFVAMSEAGGELTINAGVFILNPSGYSENWMKNQVKKIDIVSLDDNEITFRTSDKDLVMCDEPYIYLHGYDKGFGIPDSLVLKTSHKDSVIQPDNSMEITATIANEVERSVLTDYRTLLEIKSNPSITKDVTVQELYRSIEQRIHEHYYLNKLDCVPMALTRYESGVRPTVAYVTESNSSLWHSYKSNTEDHLFERIISQSDFQEALISNKRKTLFYVTSPILLDGNKEVICISFDKLIQDPDACSLFSIYYESKRLKLLRFEIGQTPAEKYIYSPSALKNMVGGSLAMLNAKPTNAVVDCLKHSKMLCTVHDDTSALNKLGIDTALTRAKKLMAGKAEAIEKYKLPKHPKQKVLNEAVENQRDVRIEDRFEFNSLVTITADKNIVVKGRTINISSRGLRLSVEDSSLFFSQQEVKISFDGLNEKVLTTPVVDQSYRIVNVSEGYINLVATGSAKEHQARRAMTRLIYSNLNKLKPTGVKDSVYGLSKAMRSVFSHNHMDIPFFVSKDKRQHFIETLLTNKFSKLSNLENKDNKDLLGLVSSPAFTNFVSKLHVELSEDNPFAEGYLLLLPRIKTKSGLERLYWIKEMDELLENENGKEFIQKIEKVAKPSILKIKLRLPGQYNDKYFGDELRYLNRMSPNMTPQLRAYADDMVAIGEISEVTDLMMAAIQADTAPSDDINQQAA